MPDVPPEIVDKIEETLIEELGKQSKLPVVRTSVLVLASILAIFYFWLGDFFADLGDFFSAYANAINVKYGGP